jgi:CubicO group peptidase (beta-lactamase class C family)
MKLSNIKANTALLFILLYVSFSSFAQQANQVLNADTLSFQLKQVMKEVGIPAISIAVVQRATVVYSAALEISKVANKSAIDTNTIFEAASLTKPVVAITALKLAEEGIIDLDKPLSDYLGYTYEGISDKRLKLITTRMVLSHTSGFPNWRNKKLDIKFAPGEKFSYSGEGFVYLQKVIEKLTQKSLEKLVDEKIFIPLGMKNSILVFNPNLHKNSTEGFNKKGIKVKGYAPTSANAAASMRTTANDYALFVIALMKNQLLKEETTNQMLLPQIGISEKDTNLSWGLGWGLEKKENDVAFWHWGDNSGYKCFVIALKNEQTALIYFTNSDKGLNIQHKLLALTTGYEFGLCEWLDYEQYDATKSKK